MDVKQVLIDAQAAIIGSVLISPEIVGDVMLRVSADDFLTPQYRHVFDAVHEQWAACQAVDVVTVLHRLGDAYRPLLVQIMADTPTAANWEAYADVMREQARLARIKDAAAKMLDAATLDEARAAVETVAENTSDGVVAPLLFLAIGGAPLGFFYKAVNTMDSMLGYVEPPYKNIGLVPAKADDVVNYIPARLSALLMLAAGGLMGLDTAAGWRIFRRDRRKHASPNSAQTESVCAGLLGVRLAGDAWYHGVLHKKEYIGDASREITHEDIPRVCRLMTVTALLTLLLSCGVKLPFAL